MPSGLGRSLTFRSRIASSIASTVWAGRSILRQPFSDFGTGLRTQPPVPFSFDFDEGSGDVEVGLVFFEVDVLE